MSFVEYIQSLEETKRKESRSRMKIDKMLEVGTIISDDDIPKEKIYTGLGKVIEVDLVSKDHSYRHAGIISKCGNIDYLIYVFETGETEWHSRDYIEQDCMVVSKPKKKVATIMDEDIKEGDMVQFGFIYSGCDLNERYALYIGEKPSSNKEVVNELFWMCGDSKPTIVDKTLMCYIHKATPNKDVSLHTK